MKMKMGYTQQRKQNALITLEGLFNKALLVPIFVAQRIYTSKY